MTKYTALQQKIHDFLTAGGILTQENYEMRSALFMDGEKVNGKVWVSYMWKRFGTDYCRQMKNFVTIIK